MRKKEKLPAIPTTYLPSGWAENLAVTHSVSVSTVESVVYGLASGTDKNRAVWNELLQMAEIGKAAYEAESLLVSKRLKALTA